MAKPLRLPSTRDGKIKRWLFARHIAAQAERLKMALEPHVRKFVEEAPGRSLEFGDRTLQMIPVAGGKKLNLAGAEAALGKEALKPYYKLVFDEKAALEGLSEKLTPFLEDLPGHDRLHVGA